MPLLGPPAWLIMQGARALLPSWGSMRARRTGWRVYTVSYFGGSRGAESDFTWCRWWSKRDPDAQKVAYCVEKCRLARDSRSEQDAAWKMTPKGSRILFGDVCRAF
jgi:hypothetical protein